MTKFQIASDLHIEAFDRNVGHEDFISPDSDCKVLILAGDIGRITKFEQIKYFLTSVCPKFKIVVYVPGNQEYYKVEGFPLNTFEEIKNKMNLLQKDISNLLILDRDVVIIDDVCIYGTTLWSEALVQIPRFIVKIPFMSTRRYNEMHFQAVYCLQKVIEYAKFKKLKLLVVSHHCPSFSFIEKKDKYSSLYASNLDYLFDKNNIHTWIFGHIHKNHDIYINGVRFVTNQRGKGNKLCKTFSKNKCIQV